MPCNSDHMEPTGKEIYLRHTAHRFMTLQRALGYFVSPTVVAASRNPYCKEDYTAELCTLIKSLTPEQEAAFVYDGRSPDARALADWWDKHKEADAKKAAKAKATKWTLSPWMHTPGNDQFLIMQGDHIVSSMFTIGESDRERLVRALDWLNEQGDAV